jgi:PST family polysaccharide transporter
LSLSVIAFVKSGLGIGASAIFGVGLVKIIALHAGPEGVGTFGLYRQFFQILTVFFTLGNGYSIIKGASEAKDKKQFLRSTSTYVLLVSLILGINVLLLSKQISLTIFSNSEYLSLIRLTPIFILFMAYHGLVKSAYSGEGKIGLSGIITAIPFLTMFITAFFSTDLMTLYLSSSLASFLVALILFKRISYLKPFLRLKRNIHFEKTSFSTVLTGAVGFLSFLLIKAICTHRLGINQTGFLEASWSLVSYVTLIFLTSLSVYYLPKISIPHGKEFRHHFFMMINTLALISLGILCLASDFFIPFLFTNEFTIMGQLLLFMAIGEYLKCINWFFIFSMIGLSYKKAYIVLDLIANLVFVSIAYLSDVKTVESFGIYYLIFQFLYLIGNVTLNHKFKIIPFGLFVFNLVIGLSIWGVVCLVK